MPSERSRQIAEFLREILAGNDPTDEQVDAFINALGAYFAQRGGMAGGRARAQKLTKRRRSEIARLAAEARWSRKGKFRETGST